MEPTATNGTTNGTHTDAAPSRKVFRRDGWKNFLTKVGTRKGANAHNCFEADVVSSIEAEELYRGDPLAARIVDLLPDDANRRGIILKTDDKEVTEEICGKLEEIQMTHWFTEAERMERWAGGAGLMPVINDGAENLGMPLDEERMSGFDHFILYEPRELRPVVWYDDPADPDPDRRSKYGRPEIYRVHPIVPSGMVGSSITYIHESRLVIFPGIKVSRRQSMSAELGWGDSIFVRLRKKLGELNMSWESAFEIIQKFILNVYKMKGFSELMLNNDEGQSDSVIVDKMTQSDLALSILNAMLIGEEDDFKRDALTVNGMPDLLQQGMSWFAAQCGYPVTKLFGISPSGMNATGEYDAVNYDDTIATYQSRHTKQRERIVRLVMLANDGPTAGVEPDLWSIEYKPQRTPSEKESAETRYIVAQTDAIYIGDEVVSREEVAKARWGGDTYSAEMTIDWDAREKQMEAAPPVVVPESQQPGPPLMGPDGLPIAGATEGQPPPDPNRQKPIPKKLPPPAAGAPNGAAKPPAAAP